jgi:hypothetical protein
MVDSAVSKPAAKLLRTACAAFVALCAASLVHGSRAAVSSTLYAGFDADGNIRLTFVDGTLIGTPTAPGTVVPTGTYTIQVNNNGLDDQGGEHFFHLLGPGVNLSVGTNLYATTTWTATFLPGSTYVYQDDLNPTTIREVFGTPGSGAGTVSQAPPQTVTVPGGGSGGAKPSSSDIVGSAVVPFRGTLTGTVDAGGRLTLRAGGKPVTSLKAGRYTVAVSDHSPRNGFIVQGIGKSAETVTGVPFVGRRSATLSLKPGQWFFYPTFVGKKTYFLVTG